MHRLFFAILRLLFILLGTALIGCRGQFPISPHSSSPLGVIFYSERENRGALYYWDWQSRQVRRLTSLLEVVSPFYLIDWSPVVGKLAYTCGYVDQAEICLRDLAGHRRQLTSNTWEDSQPRWSPDGREIAFLSRRGSGTLRAYRMSANGRDQRPLFSDPDIVSSWIVWSPDGQMLAVPSGRVSEQPLLGGQPSPVHLYLVKASTGEIIHEFSNAVLATWSPDGKELAYAYLQGEDYEIYIWNLNENKTRKLLSTSHLWSLEWSPKGDWLAFASGRLEANYVDTRLFLIRPDGSSRLDLTPPGVLAILAGPGMWSPDGRYLLANILTDRVDVGIIDISNGNLIKVTDDKHIDGARSWVWETTR